MVYAYGVRLPGTYHIKNNIPCQDDYKIVKCVGDVVIAAVADGCGSEMYSDVASKIAVNVSTAHCERNISKTSEATDILDVIKRSFSEAQRAIEIEVKEQNRTIDEYDTTLSLAVLINDILYFGHSGDSGIVALTTDGLYEKVTEQQRDEENRVYYLFFDDKWVFGQFDKKVCSVFLATDGIYETLFPKLIKDEPISIHVTLAQYFMDNRNLNIDKEDGERKVQARIEEFVKNIPDEKVNDDKTVVVLVNSSVESKLQSDDYYKEPDWEEIKRRYNEDWKRKAYPQLFKDKTVGVRNDAGLISGNSTVNDIGKSTNGKTTANVTDSVPDTVGLVSGNSTVNNSGKSTDGITTVAADSVVDDHKKVRGNDKIYGAQKQSWFQKFFKKAN